MGMTLELSLCKLFYIEPSMDYKIVVLGACYTGKTALIRVFVQNLYPEHYEPTLEDVYRRQYVTVEGESCLLHIIDTAGQHNVLLEQEVRCGDAFICAYSVDDIRSYELLEDYILKINIIKPHAPVVLVSTKCDAKQWQVSPAMGQFIAERFGVPIVETSAKTGQGVDDVFTLCVCKLRHMKHIQQDKRETNYKQCKCCSIC